MAFVLRSKNIFQQENIVNHLVLWPYYINCTTQTIHWVGAVGAKLKKIYPPTTESLMVKLFLVTNVTLIYNFLPE